MTMNPIRLSRDFKPLVEGALRRGLKSHEVGKLTEYVEDVVDAGPRVKIDALGALIEELRDLEKQTGTGRVIIAPGSPGNNGTPNDVPPINRDREG